LSIAILFLFNCANVQNYNVATKLINCRLLEFAKPEKAILKATEDFSIFISLTELKY